MPLLLRLLNLRLRPHAKHAPWLTLSTTLAAHTTTLSPVTSTFRTAPAHLTTLKSPHSLHRNLRDLRYSGFLAQDFIYFGRHASLPPHASPHASSARACPSRKPSARACPSREPSARACPSRKHVMGAHVMEGAASQIPTDPYRPLHSTYLQAAGQRECRWKWVRSSTRRAPVSATPAA